MKSTLKGVTDARFSSLRNIINKGVILNLRLHHVSRTSLFLGAVSTLDSGPGLTAALWHQPWSWCVVTETQ